MNDTLSRLDATPDWIRSLASEIDTLKFSSAFDSFAPGAVLAFGVKKITGTEAMQSFFVQIDSPLDIEHRILEVWDGPTTTYVLGEAEVAKKGLPDTRIIAPFMWLFRRLASDGPVVEWLVTAGPLKTDSVL